MASAGPLVQLVLDYFDEEQCRSFTTNLDDAALQLMDDAYSSELRSPASLLRRLLCLGLCTDAGDDLYTERMAVPRRSKQCTSATFLRPSTTSVGMARVLLLRLADPGDLTWLPGTTEHHTTMRNQLVQDWEAGRLSMLEFASTPLTFWADVAIIGGFESIWDLLMRESTLKAQRLASPIPLDRWEFWMNEKDDKSHIVSNHVREEAMREQGHMSELSFLTQGAWRMLDVLLFLADRSPGDTFLGSSFMPVIKPLTILFSFPRALFGDDNQAHDEEECYTERLDTAVRLLHHICSCTDSCVSRDSLYQTSAQLMFRWTQSDLDQFCIMAQTLTAFHDICFVHLHMLCPTGHSISQYLYGNEKEPCENALLDMLSWKCSTTCNRTTFWLSDLELQYRCLSLKWFLVRLSGSARVLQQGSLRLSDKADEISSVIHERILSKQPTARQDKKMQAGLALLQNEMRAHH